MSVHRRDLKMSDNTRIALLEQTVGHINETLIRIDRRLDSIETKFESRFDDLGKKMDAKIDSLDKKFESKFDKLDSRLWTLFFWMIAGFASTLSLLGHAVHWF